MAKVVCEVAERDLMKSMVGLNAFEIGGVGRAVYIALEAAVVLEDCGGLSVLGCVWKRGPEGDTDPFKLFQA